MNWQRLRSILTPKPLFGEICSDFSKKIDLREVLDLEPPVAGRSMKTLLAYKAMLEERIPKMESSWAKDYWSGILAHVNMMIRTSREDISGVGDVREAK